MLFRYRVELKLNYNRVALYDRTPDSEFRVEIERPFVWNINQSISFAESADGRITYTDTFKIAVSSVWENSIEPNPRPESYFKMVIDNVLGETKEDASIYLVDVVDRICKNLTLEINRHNCNRHLYQPRVEADWEHAVWNSQEYGPYVEYLESGITYRLHFI